MGIYGHRFDSLLESTSVYDKAKWQIDGNHPIKEEDVIKHFNFIFKWLSGKGLLSQEGKETSKNIDATVSLSSNDVTDEGKKFLSKYYDKYIEEIEYGKGEKKDLLDSYYKEFKK